MEIDAINEWGPKLAAWASEYLTQLRQRPVRAQTEPGDIARQIPDVPPDLPTGFEEIFQEFEDIVMPGMTHWQHPRFFAYFTANSSPPSLLAEWLTATLAAQCMLWQTSPAATELETMMLQWLRQMISLPDAFSGVIQDSASSATLAALLHARERALGFRGNTEGLAGLPACRVYCSDQVHSSVDKACWVAGIGQQNLIKLPTTGESSALDTRALEQAIVRDREAGLVPAAIVACIGGTSVGACDDISAIMDVAERHNVYVHVDAAWAGSAMICPEFRGMMHGCERVDSFVFNPHKWLFTNFDCSAHFVRDPESFVKTLAIRPTYLATAGRDQITNYSEWSIPLGRRFRALKLWFVIRSYGLTTLQQKVRDHVRWTEKIARRLEAEPDFELTSAPVLSLFSFRYAPAGEQDLDEINQQLLERINDDGRIYLTQTQHKGRYVIRFQVGQTYTTESDVAFAFDVITSLARKTSKE
ncbi:MAG: aspartate aminotransferase family protein [Planctomycetaceae bacterium]